MSAERYLYIGQAAIVLGVPESTLRKLVDAGTIDAPRLGSCRIFPELRLPEYRERLTESGHLTPPDVRAG